MSLNKDVSQQNFAEKYFCRLRFSPDIPAPVGGAVEEAVVAGGLGEDVPGDGGLAEAQAAVGAGGQPVSALYCTAPVLHCTVPVPALPAHGVTVGALEDPPRGPHLLQADRTLQQLTHTEMCARFKIKSHISA